MNFSGGPTSGQEADRLKSAIEWMRNEFSTRIRTEPPSFNVIRADRFECDVRVMGWDGDHYVERRHHRYLREHDLTKSPLARAVKAASIAWSAGQMAPGEDAAEELPPRDRALRGDE